MRDDPEFVKHLNLPALFAALEDEAWCLIKRPATFPRLQPGSDIDIFCYNLENLGSMILSKLNPAIVEQGITTSVTPVEKQHVHIDILDADGLLLRFDLYGELPQYKRISLKPAFFESVIENAESETVHIDGTPLKIYVPSDIDEAIIRYVEYNEFYWTGPDKVHHLEWVTEFLASDKIRNAFFQKLHRYTCFVQPISESQFEEPEDSLRRLLKKYTRGLRQTPLRLWPKEAYTELNRLRARRQRTRFN